MNLLAIESSTQRLSLAVAAGGRVWSCEGPGAAQASVTLLPQAARLLADAGLRVADLDAVVFGAGPGAFTGLRTACAVAQGLAYGAGRPVLGVPSLLAVADEARERTGARRVTAALDARMDELYIAHYDFDSSSSLWDAGCGLIRPEELAVLPGVVLAGNGHLAYPGRVRVPPGCAVVDLLPTAVALLRLAPKGLAEGRATPPQQARPLYIRDKVAKTEAERAGAAGPLR